ncbi:hypothetical protein [Mycolicibacterium stellerae]|uniref:hypothetical protein n=1 Tax=Mycolicibacterium stellerae TaxID=2358193 RepID=UPI000F0B161C|nr:hypothetical protein [Mycolicibacterium stellerae]
MTHTVRRLTGTALAAAALATVPMAAGMIISPAVSSACLPGETAGPTACAPFCLPGKALDVQTGLCVPVSDPAPNGVNPPVDAY